MFSEIIFLSFEIRMFGYLQRLSGLIFGYISHFAHFVHVIALATGPGNQAVECFSKYLKNGKTMLNLGSGDGIMSQYIRDTYHVDVTGIHFLIKSTWKIIVGKKYFFFQN